MSNKVITVASLDCAIASETPKQRPKICRRVSSHSKKPLSKANTRVVRPARKTDHQHKKNSSNFEQGDKKQAWEDLSDGESEIFDWEEEPSTPKKPPTAIQLKRQAQEACNEEIRGWRCPVITSDQDQIRKVPGHDRDCLCNSCDGYHFLQVYRRDPDPLQQDPELRKLEALRQEYLLEHAKWLRQEERKICYHPHSNKKYYPYGPPPGVKVWRPGEWEAELEEDRKWYLKNMWTLDEAEELANAKSEQMRFDLNRVKCPLPPKPRDEWWAGNWPMPPTEEQLKARRDKMEAERKYNEGIGITLEDWKPRNGLRRIQKAF